MFTIADLDIGEDPYLSEEGEENNESEEGAEENEIPPSHPIRVSITIVKASPIPYIRSTHKLTGSPRMVPMVLLAWMQHVKTVCSSLKMWHTIPMRNWLVN